MMPRPVLFTMLSLAVLAAFGGYILGQHYARLDLSGLVNAVAAEHVRLHGGDTQTCLGWMPEGEALPRVRCGNVVYQVNQFGNVAPLSEFEL